MPGKFIDEVVIYRCGKHTDGTAIMCSRIGYAKIPFLLSEDVAGPGGEAASQTASATARKGVGWQVEGEAEVHLSLTDLVAALEAYGITVTVDEEALERQLGPRPT